MVAAVRHGTLRRVHFHDTGRAPVTVSEDSAGAIASSPAGSRVAGNYVVVATM